MSSGIFLTDLSQRLLAVRKRFNLSQAEFAKRTGIAQPTVSKYEKGILEPTAAFLRALTEEFQINLLWLLTGKKQAATKGTAHSDVHHLGRMYLGDVEDAVQQDEQAALPPGHDLSVPVVGLNESSLKGWETPTQTSLRAEAPLDIATAEGGFAVVALGDSMAPWGIEPGYLLFCDPGLEPRHGDAVYVEDSADHAIIRVYQSEATKGGEVFVRLLGWLPKAEDNPLDAQKPFTIEVRRSLIKRIVPVVYIKTRL